jgi:two-component system sensor histidine kinase TctE
MMALARPMSLRARLELLIGFLFLAGLLTLYIAARAYGRDAADRSFDRLLAGSAISIVESVSLTNRAIEVDVPYAALEMLSAAPDDRVFYAVTGPDGATITGYADLPTAAGPEHEALVAQRRESGDIQFFNARYKGETVRFARLAREISREGVLGTVWVQVGQTRLAREMVAQESVLNALIPIAVIMLLAMSIVWFGLARALSPLRRLGDDIASRSPDDLRPIDTSVPRELRPFLQAINGFMRRLAASIDTLKAFIADASHQMRTPLAALLAQAQAARSGDPRELDRSLEAIARNGARLTHLLNQLLVDATVAHRADLRRFVAADLLEVLREAIRDTAGEIEGSDVRLRTSLNEARLQADPVLLVEAFKNLVHNAIRHGHRAETAPVEVELQRTEAGYSVQIRDRGPGIPEPDRLRVFERFVRLQTDAPGAGIGLAIARRAIEVHRGSIELLDREGGGLIVDIWLPHP